MKLLKYSASIAISFLPLVAISATAASPVIEEVEVLANGEIVVRGSGFGEGPNVVLYDDFSNTSLKDDRLNSIPLKGKWKNIAGDKLETKPGAVEVGGKSLVVRNSASALSVALEFGLPDPGGLHGLKPFQEVYFSYSVKDFGDFPGDGGSETGFSHRSATKDAWMMLGDRGDNPVYSATLFDVAAGHDLYVPAWTGAGFNVAGNSSRLSPSYWQGDLTSNWAFGGWNTFLFHGKLDPSNPYDSAEGFFAFVNSNEYSVNIRQGNLMSDLTNTLSSLIHNADQPYWDRIKFFAWMNTGTAEVIRAVDNIYVAVGRNANARVVITDNKKLESSKVLVHLLPTSWSDSFVEAQLPELERNHAYYVHVISASESASEAAELCFKCPAAPKELRIK